MRVATAAMREERSCCHCGRFYVPDPRQRNQRYCGRKMCQRARKAAWQREKMRTDADYRANQRGSQEAWLRAHAGYWKRYRATHPEQAERNRIRQRVRNRRCREPMHTPIAKMDATADCKSGVISWSSGPFWLIPVVAKMDAIKVNIYRITEPCP
jgi:hypothetical protein